jgi:hypothetical protein
MDYGGLCLYPMDCGGLHARLCVYMACGGLAPRCRIGVPCGGGEFGRGRNAAAEGLRYMTPPVAPISRTDVGDIALGLSLGLKPPIENEGMITELASVCSLGDGENSRIDFLAEYRNGLYLLASSVA